MRISFILALLLAKLALVYSHTYLSALSIDGTKLPEGDCLRPHRSWEKENPIGSISSPDMTCGFLPWAAEPANRKCPVKAGSIVSMQWHHNYDSPTDMIIAETHKGPCMVYMAKSDTGAGQVWFKVWEQGYDTRTQKWCVDNVRANGGVFSFMVPTDIEPGNYLLRGEILAHHDSHKIGGVQPYVHCAEITISGSGKAKPTGVALPGAYTPTEPGIYLNIYGPINSYTIPGPAVYTPGATIPATQPATSPPTQAATPPPTQAATPPPTQAATPTPTQVATPPPTTQSPSTPSSPPKGATSAPDSSIKITVHSDTTMYWIAVAIDAGSSTVDRVELKDSSMTTFAVLDKTSWGYWSLNPSGPLAVPITLRITASSGAQVDLTEVIKSLSIRTPIDSGKSFASSTTPAAPSTPVPTSASTPTPTTPAAPVPASPSTPQTPPSGQDTVAISIHAGSNQWWTAAAVMNALPAKVELKDSTTGATWKAMESSNWGYYTYATSGTALKYPITIRATSENGKVASAEFAAATDGLKDTDVSF